MACKRSSVRLRYSPQFKSPNGDFFVMEYCCYILYSAKIDRYYIGHTEDLELRLLQHNSGISTFTSKATDWGLVYKQAFKTREEARNRELEIKKKKSRKYIEWIISAD